jgi:hypothetical protein
MPYIAMFIQAIKRTSLGRAANKLPDQIMSGAEAVRYLRTLRLEEGLPLGASAVIGTLARESAGAGAGMRPNSITTPML